MQRSSNNKLQAVSSKRKNWWPSTIALAIISIVGALGINQKLAADSANAFGGGALAGGTTGGTSTGTGTGTTPSTPAPATNTTKTATGDPIYYQFGTIQVKVKQVNGKLTTITYLQDQASAGRAQAFPYLVQYAIKANGTNFGNLSGATYTTEAFKQALDSATSKL